ncbi:hypothetical protein HAX54_053303, partial [Datura stramonium]|nr:hypothetical protein [Datura stramonium]
MEVKRDYKGMSRVNSGHVGVCLHSTMCCSALVKSKVLEAQNSGPPRQESATELLRRDGLSATLWGYSSLESSLVKDCDRFVSWSLPSA